MVPQLITMEQHHQVQLLLNSIGSKYLYLVREYKFDNDLIKIPRSAKAEDKDVACTLEFDLNGNDLSISILLGSGEYTHDDVCGFLRRADKFMRDKIGFDDVPETKRTLH